MNVHLLLVYLYWYNDKVQNYTLKTKISLDVENLINWTFMWRKLEIETLLTIFTKYMNMSKSADIRLSGLIVKSIRLCPNLFLTTF